MTLDFLAVFGARDARSWQHVPDPARLITPPQFFAFPIEDLLDDNRCYRWLLEKRWPGGKPACPRCAHIILIVQGFTQGKGTNPLAREFGCEYDTLLKLRHRWPAGFDKQAVVEMDEMYQNARKMGTPHPDPADPPRRRRP